MTEVENAALTETQMEFLRDYYFDAQKSLEQHPDEAKADFRVSKVLSLKYLSSMFWTAMSSVGTPVPTETSVVYVNPKQLHSLERSIVEKHGSLQSYTFKEMAYEILRKAALPLRVDEIVSEGRKNGMLNTKGVSPDATLASLLNTGIKQHGSQFPFAKIGPFFYLRHQEADIMMNILITPSYQRLGMRLWENRYKYIPPEFEHRFLCYKTSTIGDGVGLGIFIRDGVQIPQGSILCEYTGIVTHTKEENQSSPDENILHPYSVNTGAGTDNESVIHGRDHNGIVQCYAALINDAGPVHANATYVEFEEAPGRVFVITKRRLDPGEEVFITYGCKYWDIDHYPAQDKFSSLTDWIGLLAGCPPAHPPGEIVIESCLFCRATKIPYRLMSLHRTYECPDIIRKQANGEDIQFSPEELNSLPLNNFTSSTNRNRRTALSSTTMVDERDPLTHDFSHEVLVPVQQTS